MEQKLKRKPGRPPKYCPIQEDLFEDDTEEAKQHRERCYEWRKQHEERYREYQREYQKEWRDRNRDRHNEIYRNHSKRKRTHKLIEKYEQAKEDVQ